MRLTRKERHEQIRKHVDEFVESFKEVDQTGKVIGTTLQQSPDVLRKLYRQRWFMELEDDYDRLYAKMYFKSFLPYKEWRQYVTTHKGELARQIEDYQESIDPRYNRITSRREGSTQ